MGVMGGLGVREHMMLELEGSWWRRQGPKDAVIADLLGMTTAGYYRTLSRLIDRAEAEAAYPLVVRRLRRMRHARRAERAARRLG